MEPTNDEAAIRKVLAEFMGWQRIIDDSVAAFPLGERAYSIHALRPVPDYTHDLNAMHEVEAELERRGQRATYGQELIRIAAILEKTFDDWQYWELFDILHATAEQRARAAYAVIKAQQGVKNGTD